MINPLTARQVADRLGVELPTVYAYASRGALTRHPGPDGRTSRYDADEVELLARRARPRSTRRRLGAVDVVIGTTVSEIGDGWIRYRGHDLAELVDRWAFDDVCRLLWTGELEPPRRHASATGDAGATRRAVAEAAERVVAALPVPASVTARLAAGAIAASSWVPAATTEATSLAAGEAVIDALIASLALVGAPGPDDGSVAQRLWPRLSPLPAQPERVDALDTALILLAEHELATSTLAVRVAASTRAGPAETVLAGLGTVSGPFHGRAAVRVHQRLVDGDPPVGDDLLNGFGHPVHQSGDPRFAPLMARVLAIAEPDQRDAIERYVAVPKVGGPNVGRPNVDVALGSLGFVAEMEPGLTEAVFAVARTAGWLAHAFEETDEAPLRFRGRTLYRGPR